jgi:hypothetical protein
MEKERRCSEGEGEEEARKRKGRDRSQKDLVRWRLLWSFIINEINNPDSDPSQLDEMGWPPPPGS